MVNTTSMPFLNQNKINSQVIIFISLNILKKIIFNSGYADDDVTIESIAKQVAYPKSKSKYI